MKRQRRKQSNRESARRSRLRKQAECEALAVRVNELMNENVKLRAANEQLLKLQHVACHQVKPQSLTHCNKGSSAREQYRQSQWVCMCVYYSLQCSRTFVHTWNLFNAYRQAVKANNAASKTLYSRQSCGEPAWPE